MTEPKLYENFDLQIEKLGRSYWAFVRRSPAGEGASVFRPPYTDRELHEILVRLTTAHRDLGAADPPVLRTAEEVGSRLFDTLFANDVRHLWVASWERASAEGKGLRLRLLLRKVPRFEAWPWEILFDPFRRRFLSLSGDTPVVRYLDLPVETHLLRVEPPLRILVGIASPAGYAPLDAEREWERLCQALDGWVNRGWVVLERLARVTLEGLRRGLPSNCHILHLIGHGQFDSKTRQGALVLENEVGRGQTVTGTRLSAILAPRKDLRLVVLNACHGSQSSGDDPFTGVAQALVGSGVPAVLAMQSRVTDSAAIAFTEHFYGALTRNFPVDAALADARMAMFSREDDLEWTTPVLYMRSPDGQLFHFLPDSAPEFPQSKAGPSAVEKRLRFREFLKSVPSWVWRTAAILSVVVAISFPAVKVWRDPSLRYSLWNPPDCPSPPGIPMAFAKIPLGSFFMGPKPGSEVTISQPFCMGRFEVTQAQWKKVMGTNPSQHYGDAYPVERVTLEDVQQFLTLLNAREPGANYRLPRNAQWEYAARAGTVNPYNFEGDAHDLYRYGNCLEKGHDGNDTHGGTTRVGSFEPNAWGLFDIYGNVAEWVEDEAPRSALTEGGVQPVWHIRRGGGYRSSPTVCDSINQSAVQDRRYLDTGFRLIRDPVK